jgi:hypothetical protein
MRSLSLASLMLIGMATSAVAQWFPPTTPTQSPLPGGEVRFAWEFTKRFTINEFIVPLSIQYEATPEWRLATPMVARLKQTGIGEIGSVRLGNPTYGGLIAGENCWQIMGEAHLPISAATVHPQPNGTVVFHFNDVYVKAECDWAKGWFFSPTYYHAIHVTPVDWDGIDITVAPTGEVINVEGWH